MDWSEEVEGGEVFASAISAATRRKGWKDDRTYVSSVLPSTRASPPYWVSDGDAVPTDDSPMGLLSVACDCKEVIILVQTLHFCISF